MNVFIGKKCNVSQELCLLTPALGFKVVVEKDDIIQPEQDGSRYVFRLNRVPMCDYMQAFIHKLRELNSPEMMNRVLENFSAVLVVRDNATQKVLFYGAFVFEVTPPGYGPRCNFYKLNGDGAAAFDSRRYTS